jgi:hypothetical protein
VFLVLVARRVSRLRTRLGALGKTMRNWGVFEIEIFV